MPTIEGTPGDDGLSGTPGADTISDLLGGNDTLTGGDGDDQLTVHRIGLGSTVIIDGGAGADQINDVLVSGTVHGGSGDDRISAIEMFGGAVYGDDGNDWVFATRELNVPNQPLLVDGGAGNDVLSYNGAGPGAATVIGGAGDDYLIVGGASIGEPDRITIDAGDGADRVDLGQGGMIDIRLGAGADIVFLQSATFDSSFQTGLHAVVLDFDPAQDRLESVMSGTLRIGQMGGDAVLQAQDPSQLDVWQSLVQLVGVPVSVLSGQNLGLPYVDDQRTRWLADPWLVGTAENDQLVLRGGFTGLDGGQGDDVLSTTLSGSATLTGGPGADTVQGGSGADRIEGGSGNDSLSGAEGDDTLVELSGQNVMRGGDGNDVIVGGYQFDDINGNKGNDTIDGGSGGDDWLVGGQGNDLITAHAGGNILYGNLGNDTLHGGSGAEILRGGQGDDVITGGGGADWLSGDRGNDTLTGGAGADIFHSFSGAGVDRVLDFSVAEGDRIQLDAGTAYTVSQVGADTVIDMGNGDQVILVGVTAATLPPGSIIIV